MGTISIQFSFSKISINKRYLNKHPKKINKKEITKLRIHFNYNNQQYRKLFNNKQNHNNPIPSTNNNKHLHNIIKLLRIIEILNLFNF